MRGVLGTRISGVCILALLKLNSLSDVNGRLIGYVSRLAATKALIDDDINSSFLRPRLGDWLQRHQLFNSEIAGGHHVTSLRSDT